MTEAQLHRAVAAFLRLALKPPEFFTMFPAGGGGRVRGAQLKAMGLRSGMPDILIFAPESGYTFVVGIELKTKKGTQSAEQKATEKAFHGIGGFYGICRSVEEVEAVLHRFAVPLHASVMGSGTKVAA